MFNCRISLYARKFLLLLAATVLLPFSAQTAQYFVSKQGSDDNHGASREAAFLTIQRGVDTLQPGDTLTIGPGEYFETVCRTNLGSAEADTVIRSEIPGMAILRGDVPAPEFKPVEGYRFVYAAPLEHEPRAVLEHHTMYTLLPKANVAELEFAPGFFHYKTNSHMLYISNSDLAPPDNRRYTLAVSGTHGLELYTPERVTVEGLAATGFYPEWGIALISPDSCTVRDCVAFMNVGGVNLSPTNGINGNGGPHNVVDGCTAYGNTFAGIARYGANHDVIRNCRLYKNVREGHEHFGVIHYGAMHGPLLITNNISWGHNFNFSVKPIQQDRLEHNVGLGFIRINPKTMVHNLIAGGNEYDRGSQAPADNILCRRESELDRDFEFADPLNLDFRLQPDSRFRASAPDATDRGPYPYEPDIFYLSPDGDDGADGLSMRKPWRTLERALKALRPGDTLYLAQGEYTGATCDKAGDRSAPIRICGRGRGTVLISGRLTLNRCTGLEIARLDFAGGLALSDGRDIVVNNCTFFRSPDGLTAEGVNGLEATHSVFADGPLDFAKCREAMLTGNIYAGTGKPAVRVDEPDAILYSDYNGYADATQCMKVDNALRSLADLRKSGETHSRKVEPQFAMQDGVPRIQNKEQFKSLGPNNTDLGPYHPYQVEPDTIDLVGPFLHSVHDTTANIEWWASHPAEYQLAWGGTPAMTNTLRKLKGGRFNTYSLTGLEPGQQYHFAIRSVKATARDSAEPLPVLRPQAARLSFTTAAAPAPPRVYYVAPDGNDTNSGLSRDEALRTINRAAARVGPGDTVVIAQGEYSESVRVRAAGTRDRPITFRAAPGEEAALRGENLGASFSIVAKPDIHIDGLYFRGQGFWRDGCIVRRSPRVRFTRCLNVLISADQSPEMVVRNCVAHGGWTSVALSRCAGSLVENNVFIMTILRQITCNAPAVVRNNIFCECVRNKTHQTLLRLSPDVTESNNCFYLRWPEDEKLAVNNLPLPQYRVRTGSDAFAANPMMPSTPGRGQGWQKTSMEDFDGFFTTTPQLVKRGIGLQPDAFADHAFRTNWVCDVEWADAVIVRTNAAAALVRAGRNASGLAAYTNLVADVALSDRLEAEILKQASLCSQRMKDYDLAVQLARKIPVPALSIHRQMQLMLEQKQYAELLDNFTQKALGGRAFHLSYVYPEQEDVMSDLFYYRSIAHREAGNLQAAEADLSVMNEKRSKLSYRSGEAIHDRAWLRLGNFYRDCLRDDDQALEAYSNVLSRTTWAPWARPPKPPPPKPVATGASDTLVEATTAVCDILRKRGRQDEIPRLQLYLALAQAQAAAALLDTKGTLAPLKRAIELPGVFTADMAGCEAEIDALDHSREEVVRKIGEMTTRLTRDTRDLLAKAAVSSNPEDRRTGLRALLVFWPPDKVNKLGVGE